MNKQFKILLFLSILIFTNCDLPYKQMKPNQTTLTTQSILDVLDFSNDGYYSSFVSLGDPYSYLIDSRLNVFRGDDNRWAIAIERLGYNPRSGRILLEIYYYGNCLNNLEVYNNRTLNYYNLEIIDNFIETQEGESIKPNAKYWLVRGNKVLISHQLKDYSDAGIDILDYEEFGIGIADVARLTIIKHGDSFRATDEELYKSIPKELDKILVIDQWYHKDFYLNLTSDLTDAQLRASYKISNGNGMNFEEFKISTRKQIMLNNEEDAEEWKLNRPSSYETWQQLAKVIVYKDAVFYKPTLKPNSHWKNWLDSGGL